VQGFIWVLLHACFAKKMAKNWKIYTNNNKIVEGCCFERNKEEIIENYGQNKK